MYKQSSSHHITHLKNSKSFYYSFYFTYALHLYAILHNYNSWQQSTAYTSQLYSRLWYTKRFILPTTLVATIFTLTSAHQKKRDDDAWSAGSICEGYGPSDTYLSDTPQWLCITEASYGVYISPMLEMRLQRWHALPHSLFENLLWQKNNSTRGNTGREAKIWYATINYGYIDRMISHFWFGLAE